MILLDEQLEAEHSLKLTKELKAASPSSAILITVRSMVGGGRRPAGGGGHGMIHKSIEPDELVDAVRAVAGRRAADRGPARGADDDP